ncbi:conjugal transfer protein TrbD [Halodesulfovibrio sp.]|jgi:type IV secretory pathway TrbD component|uniref:conjugal transfer protein TrbD n=1 Tax=Halodesulfovibrio sp. TaxID=1912772 RepID=UPI0025F68C7F|nr:conjugal transfer protein TrbD [Halodesulfovibrio sp.]MCT4533747.1 conjugal transfer protein TrbD [Halodesulfovibrio sp.]
MRKIPVHQSLHRHTLVLGGERDLVMLAALISFLIGIGGFTLPSALVGAGLWTASLFVLRQMAKKDPQMSIVWRRHDNLQDFYEAKGTPWQQSGWKG